MTVHPSHVEFETRPAERARDDRIPPESLRLMALFGVLAIVSALLFLVPYLAVVI